MKMGKTDFSCLLLWGSNGALKKRETNNPAQCWFYSLTSEQIQIQQVHYTTTTDGHLNDGMFKISSFLADGVSTTIVKKGEMVHE